VTTAADGSGRVRRAHTSIHFLLQGEEFSAWHRLSSDETWLHHEGCEVEVHLLHDEGVVTSHVTSRVIGRDAGAYQCTIAAHTCFAAASVDTASYTFVSCVVGEWIERFTRARSAPDAGVR
jgi:hypothetical protein